MKYIILILVLLMAAHAHAGWFHNSDDQQRIKQYEQQLTSERHATGGFAFAAGVLAIAAVVLLNVGTALGSKLRRDAAKKEEERHE
jgi:hypothetical protein